MISLELKKRCTRCERTKPLDAFYWNKTKAGTHYRHGQCQECRREQNRAAAKTARGKAVKRAGILRRAYGLTEDAYIALDVKQCGLCAICQQPETKLHRDGAVLRLSVDHNHASDAVRGLLCSACNVGLGSFGDDPGRLRAAAEYLDGSWTCPLSGGRLLGLSSWGRVLAPHE